MDGEKLNRSPERNTENGAWGFDGSAWEFARLLRWALVFRQLIVENRIHDWSEIGTNEEKLKQTAADYGITLRNISEEMTRISQELSVAYAMIDLRKRSGLETNEPE